MKLSCPIDKRWFLEPFLSCLPSSLRGIALSFWDYPRSLDIFTTGLEEEHEFWGSVDGALTSPRFPELCRVEIRWHRGWSEMNEDDIVRAHRLGLLKFLPKLCNRGVLWCGYFYHDMVYPVTEPAIALAADNHAEWKRLSRERLFAHWRSR